MEALEFLESKGIFNHPRLEDVNNKNSYEVEELLEEFANLKLTEPVVSRSIGKDTKPILMKMTEFQKFKVDNSCFYCRFGDLDYNDIVCKKCRSENKSDQYYG